MKSVRSLASHCALSRCLGILAILAFALTTQTALASIIYVKANGNNNNAGTTWALAKRSVQQGINTAISGDQVWVAAGTYLEAITLKPGVAVYGGFAGGETDLSQRNIATNVVILDAQNNNDVVTASNVGSSTAIDGFTIRHGYSGVYVSGSSTPKIYNNIITNNSTGINCSSPDVQFNTITACSRGMYINNSANVQNNTVIGNAGGDGAGIYVSNGTAVIAFNYIANNSSSGVGGGILCDYGSSPVIRQNRILSNNGNVGGGVYDRGTGTVVRSNLVANNTAVNAAGIRLNGDNSAQILNNTIVSNVASQSGNAGGIGIQNSSGNIANNIVANNTYWGIRQEDVNSNPQPANNCFFGNVSGDYSGMQGGPGDLYSTNPRFMNADGGDYHLLPGSPCINAGDNQYVGAGNTDIDNLPRISGPSVDIGASEKPITIPAFDFNRDGSNDLIWQNDFTGDVSCWFMNGPFWSGSYNTLALGVQTSWKIVGVADLNGDTNPDLIWQNITTGDVSYWLMNGTQFGSGDYLARSVPLDWKIVSVVDMNGDGKPDFIWQNQTTGDVSFWQMNGIQRTNSDLIARAVPTQWKIVGTADFNSDGKNDLVWWNTQTGDVVVWYMNSFSWTGNWDYIARGVPAAWKPAAIQDLNGDGSPDFVWQNTQNGDVSYWLMSGLARTASDYLYRGVPLAWRIAGRH